jgi:hypothetical protein
VKHSMAIRSMACDVDGHADLALVTNLADRQD